MLQVDVNLIGSVIYFSPPMDNKHAESSLQEDVNVWLNDILHRAKLMTPLIDGQVNN